MNKEIILNKIKINQVDEALDVAEEYFKENNQEYFQIIILLQRQFREQEQNRLRGLISNEESMRNYSIISNRLIQIVSSYEKGNTSNAIQIKKEVGSELNRKRQRRVFAYIIGLIGVVVISCIFLLKHYKSSNIVIPKNDTFNILLLPFNPDRSCNFIKSHFESALYDRFETIQFRNKEKINIIQDFEVECPIKIDDAKRLGEKYNSNLVIWGNYDDLTENEPQVRLRYLLLKGNEVFRPFLGESEYEKIENMEMIRDGFLQQDIDYILYTSMALSALKNLDFDQFENYLQKIKLNKEDLLYNVHLCISLSKRILTPDGKSNSWDEFSFERKMATIYNLLDDNEKAISFYQEDKKKNNNECSSQLAFIYVKTKQYNLAIKEIFSGNCRDSVMYTEILYKMGEYEKGLNFINRLIETKSKRAFTEELLFIKYKFLQATGDSLAAEKIYPEIIKSPIYANEHINNLKILDESHHLW